MHIDLEQSGGSSTFHSTVCIIGGGIAGLTLATRLARAGLEVHLLEAGGFSPEDRSQSLYRAEMAADTHKGVHEGRFRLFGGTSTQWGGQLLPFTHDTFIAPKNSVSLSWPVAEEELTPYYGEVQRILGADGLPFTAELLPALGHPAVSFPSNLRLRFSKWAPFNRRNIAPTLGQEALTHPKLTVFTHANATSLHKDAANPARIGSARVVNYSGREFTFTATHFVVSTGTVESSRLLLCSPEVPNPHDQIGRYFHDHISFHAARFLSPAREKVVEQLGPFFVDGTLHTCKIEATPELRERENLLAVMAHVVVQEPEDSGIAAVRNLLRSLQHGRLKEALVTNLLPTLRGTGDVVRLLFYTKFRKRRAISSRATLYLNIDLEQVPDPNNRIRLSADRTDALGLPVTIVDWRIGDIEKDTAYRFAQIIRAHLQSMGLDPGEWDPAIAQGTVPPMEDTLHPMGGLRMGDDPASSVVDRNLTVHGTENLSIASCAVFPSGSSSNPTFTMMALTLRLADRLITRFSGPAATSGQDSREELPAPVK